MRSSSRLLKPRLSGSCFLAGAAFALLLIPQTGALATQGPDDQPLLARVSTPDGGKLNVRRSVQGDQPGEKFDQLTKGTQVMIDLPYLQRALRRAPREVQVSFLSQNGCGILGESWKRVARPSLIEGEQFHFLKISYHSPTDHGAEKRTGFVALEFLEAVGLINCEALLRALTRDTFVKAGPCVSECVWSKENALELIQEWAPVLAGSSDDPEAITYLRHQVDTLCPKAPLNTVSPEHTGWRLRVKRGQEQQPQPQPRPQPQRKVKPIKKKGRLEFSARPIGSTEPADTVELRRRTGLSDLLYVGNREHKISTFRSTAAPVAESDEKDTSYVLLQGRDRWLFYRASAFFSRRVAKEVASDRISQLYAHISEEHKRGNCDQGRDDFSGVLVKLHDSGMIKGVQCLMGARPD